MHATTYLDLSTQEERVAAYGVPVNGDGPSSVDTTRSNAPAGGDASTEEAEDPVWVFLRHRLAEIVHERGLTYQELGKRAGLGESSVGDVIRGKSRDPKMSTLLKVARTLDIPLAALLPQDGLPQEDVGGQQVFKVPLLEPRGTATAVVVPIGPELKPQAKANQLLAWAVTSSLQSGELQIGDIVVADTGQRRPDGSAFLLAVKDEVMVARVVFSPPHAGFRIELDGMKAVVVDQAKVKIYGRVCYMVRPIM